VFSYNVKGGLGGGRVKRGGQRVIDRKTVEVKRVRENNKNTLLRKKEKKELYYGKLFNLKKF